MIEGGAALLVQSAGGEAITEVGEGEGGGVAQGGGGGGIVDGRVDEAAELGEVDVVGVVLELGDEAVELRCVRRQGRRWGAAEGGLEAADGAVLG